MKFKLLLLVILFQFGRVIAQTFEIEQIEQLFRPRLKFDTKYLFDSKFADTSGTFNSKEANAVVTFPIKTKLDADLKLDLSSLKLKDILKNSVRLRASQTLGVVRVNARQLNVGFDSLPQKNNYTVAAGLLGTWLTKKYRVGFYSANLAVAEQDRTFNKMVPRVSGVIGQLHIRGLRKNYFYGLALSYSDRLFVPAPFFGGSVPISNHFVFNYILPVQLNVQYKTNNLLITTGISADGYRTGMEFQRQRLNVNYTSGVAYASMRYKFNKIFVVRVEGGYVFYQNWRYTESDLYRTNFNLRPGIYAQVGFNVLFGKSLFEKVLDNFVNK